jgi:hypothetical protein
MTTDATSPVHVAPDAADNGFAALVGGLVEGNLEAHPERIGDLARLHLDVGLVSTDADVSITLRFGRGKLVIHDGILPDVVGVVRGTTDAILDMTMLRNGPLGLPILWDDAGLKVIGRIRRGELSLPWAPWKSLRLLPLLRLLSVAE